MESLFLRIMEGERSIGRLIKKIFWGDRGNPTPIQMASEDVSAIFDHLCGEKYHCIPSPENVKYASMEALMLLMHTVEIPLYFGAKAGKCLSNVLAKRRKRD